MAENDPALLLSGRADRTPMGYLRAAPAAASGWPRSRQRPCCRCGTTPHWPRPAQPPRQGPEQRGSQEQVFHRKFSISRSGRARCPASMTPRWAHAAPRKLLHGSMRICAPCMLDVSCEFHSTAGRSRNKYVRNQDIGPRDAEWTGRPPRPPPVLKTAARHTLRRPAPIAAHTAKIADGGKGENHHRRSEAGWAGNRCGNDLTLARDEGLPRVHLARAMTLDRMPSPDGRLPRTRPPPAGRVRR